MFMCILQAPWRNTRTVGAVNHPADTSHMQAEGLRIARVDITPSEQYIPIYR